MTTETPTMARALSDLAMLLARQLETAAEGIDTGTLTPWQLCGIAAQLDQAKGRDSPTQARCPSNGSELRGPVS